MQADITTGLMTISDPSLPLIMSSNIGSYIYDGETDVIIQGLNFGAVQGTGIVELNTAEDGSGTGVGQTVTAWADDEITITISRGALADGTVYMIVTNDVSDTSNGYETRMQSLVPGISYDNEATGFSTFQSTLTYSHTIGSGYNRMLVVSAGTEAPDTGPVVSGVTYNGQPLTYASSMETSQNGYRAYSAIWYLLEQDLPPAGTYDVVINLTASVDILMGASISLEEVKQTAPEATASDESISSTYISTNITTLTDNTWVVDAVMCGEESAATPDGGQVERFDFGGNATAQLSGSTKPVATAGATTVGWTSLGANRMAQSVIAVAQHTYNPPPKITGGTLASDNSYVEVTFSEGVYTDTSSNPVIAADFDFDFLDNGGTATGITIDSVTNTSGGALAGGETAVRVYITVTGGIQGVETIRIKPADGASIYNSADAAMEASQQTGLMTLSIPSWYNSAWGYRIKITIDSSNVTADLNNFPYLIHIASNNGLRDSARADGFDLLFTGDDGLTKLDHEVEKYVTSTGELVAWVRIPFLSSSADTDLYLYYGNPSAADQSNATGVWDAGYKSVWHVSETPTVDTNAWDSTSNNNDGLFQGGMTTGDSVSGKIGGALDLDGFDDYISTTNTFVDPQTLTISSWFKTGIASGKKIMGFQLTQTGEGAGNFDRQVWLGTDGKLHLAAYDDNLASPDQTASPATYTDDNWHYVVGIRDDTDDTLRLYVDGSEVASVGNGKAETYTGYFRIGSWRNAGWANALDGYFPGNIDEIRISETVRTADWISTEYNNQSDASGSISVGHSVKVFLAPLEEAEL
jgi:hypothetical protein